MKLVRFERDDGAPPRLGLLTARGVVPLTDATMEGLIDEFDRRRADLERLVQGGNAVALEDVQLLAPLPRPGKILCSTGAYGEPAPLLMTLKSAESVIGPGQAIRLPPVDDSWTLRARSRARTGHPRSN
jgi:hypothetical protein